MLDTRKNNTNTDDAENGNDVDDVNVNDNDDDDDVNYDENYDDGNGRYNAVDDARPSFPGLSLHLWQGVKRREKLWGRGL